MLIYVEWKFDLNKNSKVNILRILLDKDPTIKYDVSTTKFLLGSQIVGINQEFNEEQIYFTRVKIGSGKKIISGDVNEVQLFIKETHTQTQKSLDVYIASTKAALTTNLKHLYWINNTFGIDGETFDDKLKELKKYGMTNFTNLSNDQYIFKVSSERIN